MVSNDRKMYDVLMRLIKSFVLGGKSVSVINILYHNGMNSTKKVLNVLICKRNSFAVC